MTFLDPQFAEVSNQFSGVIYQRSIEGVDGNVIISPLSILTAISFLMLGASGTTLSQMKSSLNYGDLKGRKLERTFYRAMAKFQGQNRVTLDNKIYDVENDSEEPRMKGIATKIYLSKIKNTNFGGSDEAKLILFSSISIKDQLLHDTNTFYEGDFFKNERDTVEAEYLSLKESLKYGEFKDLDATALQLPFEHSNASLMFLLPNSKTGLPALESKLHQINFGDLSQRMSREDIHAIIPKIEIERETILNDPLKKIGMDRMFSDDAEFDNLAKSSEPLKISKAGHKTSFAISKKANEYSTITKLEDAICASCGPKQFVANRPFMFAVIQESTVIFMGRKVQ